jgi:DNA-nicking Smr family endonuclease
MKRKLPSLDKRYTKHRALTPQEEQVWREEVGEKAEPSPPPPENARPLARAKNGIKKPESRPDPAPSRIKKEDVAAGPIDSHTLAKLRRGRLKAEATLDLHGHTQLSGHAALMRFIERCRADGIRLALVITGKGRSGGGALRELLPRWLEETPLRGSIIAYDIAGPRHGGEGAWYVRIRKGSGLGGQG